MTINSIALKSKKALQLIVQVLGGERGAKIPVGRGVRGLT